MADVPQVPGVPPLASYAPGGLALMARDTFVGYGANLQPAWGLYSDGQPVIVADSVVGFGFRKEWVIADYPIERGGFESYDRVDTPYAGRMQFAAGTNEETRRELLRSLDAATADGNLTKYDVVTPEIIYQGVNVQHYDYDRKPTGGLGLLVVDVWLVEIREQNTGTRSAQSPSGSGPQSDGSVQPSDVPLPTPDPRASAPASFVVT